MATVETLELKIVDSSIKTANGLNKLAATLQRLKNITTGNLGLNKVSNQMEKLNKALSGINEEYVQRLERVARALKTISNNGKLKLPTYNQLKRATEPKKPKEVDAPQAPTGVNAFLASLRALLGISNATKTSLNGIAGAANKTGDAMKNASKRTYGFIDSAKFLLKYQLIFTVFSTLANALKEGIGNLYNWSKAMGGSFARSLDTAKSKVTLLKNSVATALAPALTALIPVFNAVANAVVFCLNAIAQFISAIRGLGTWTKATEAVGDYTEAVKGAGAAQKGLLASFDELNIIASKSGGGGGGMANAWEGAFEEKELSPFFKWISDHLLLVQTLVVGIGGAFLGWKLSASFTSVLTSLAAGNWKAAVIVGIGAALIWLVTHWDEVKVAASNAWETVKKWFGMKGDALRMTWESVLNWFKNKWNDTSDAVSNAWEAVKSWWTENVSTPFKIAWLGVMNWFTTKWNGASAAVSGAWAAVKNWFGENVASPIKTAWESTLTWLSNMWATVSGAISGAWSALSNWFKEDVAAPIKTALEPVVGWITTYIVNPVLSVVQPVIDLINKVMAWGGAGGSVPPPTTSYDHRQYHTGAAFKYDGSSPRDVYLMRDKVPSQISQTAFYADGGFVDKGQLFVAREAGPELVGTIGGRSAVANNDQIVAGVASGVAAGQAEQNALLRKQNELLTQILRKEMTAKIVPSAALGRVNAQSNEMYSRMAGVST